MAIIYPIDTILSDPGKRGGQPIIAGTNIRVSDLVASHLYRGRSPDELTVNFMLNLGQVYAALAYYYDHKAVMDEMIREEAAEAEQLLSDLEASGKLIRIE